jgi:hypothetical protein
MDHIPGWQVIAAAGGTVQPGPEAPTQHCAAVRGVIHEYGSRCVQLMWPPGMECRAVRGTSGQSIGGSCRVQV